MTGGVRHGTYAGAMWHQKYGAPICLDCKEARRQYMANWRAKDPANRQYSRDLAKVNSRAVWRLADLHPTQFVALVEEEWRKLANGDRP